MSTKAIREVLELLAEDPGLNRNAHWCPWHRKTVEFVRVDRDGHVYRCPQCGEQDHDDRASGFCWCEK